MVSLLLQALNNRGLSATRIIIAGFAALLIPLVAELASPSNGLGFDVLLCWPFEFAYTLLVGGVFLFSNMVNSLPGLAFQSFTVGLLWWLGWFIISLMAVGQLHISLGYSL